MPNLCDSHINPQFVFEKHIESTGYCVEEIKLLTDVIPDLVEVNVNGLNRFERYDPLLKAGNTARELAKDADGLHKGNAVLMAHELVSTNFLV